MPMAQHLGMGMTCIFVISATPREVPLAKLASPITQLTTNISAIKQPIQPFQEQPMAIVF